MILLMALTALAAEEPCYGHAAGNRVDSEHFWVEWDGDVITQAQAEDIAAYAEQARAVYADELGWPITERAIVYEVIAQGDTGIGGLAQTRFCTGEPVPNIELYVGEYTDERAFNVTAHELGHAAEYGYMGNYIDGVISWLWFMEGTATWLAFEVDDNDRMLRDDVSGYLDHPELALHHGIEGFLQGDKQRHMYGTSFLAGHITEVYGATALRDLWEAGGEDTGTLLYFPDVAESAGLPFDTLWPRFMAAAAVGDTRWGRLPDGAVSISATPGDSGEESDDDLAPQGLGMNVVSFGPGKANKALQIIFDGDPDVDWWVVLARAQGTTLLDYVPLAVEDGHAEGWLSEHTRHTEAYLVVSPVAADGTPHGYAWESAWIPDEGPMDAAVPLAEPETLGACGCAHGGASPLWLALLPLMLVRRQEWAANQA